MGRYRSLCVLMDSNWLLWVQISPSASLLVFMGPYRSVCVLIDFNGFLWDFKDPYESY